jgi:ABC-type Na+ efflux pump permease subunit
VILDDLLGERAALRLRVGSAVLIAALVLGGCTLFLFESQTLGRIALILGVAWAAFWIGLKYLARTGEEPQAAIKRRRGVLIVSGLVIVGAGWLAFFTLWEELGLLLVVFGAIPLLLVTIGVKRDPLASPMDGPPFGDTGPT